MAEKSNRLGALWASKIKSEKGPVLTGEIEGKRVVVFKNKKWTEDEDSKQPLYHVLLSTLNGNKADKA
jgi:hypothetical protein